MVIVQERRESDGGDTASASGKSVGEGRFRICIIIHVMVPCLLSYS